MKIIALTVVAVATFIAAFTGSLKTRERINAKEDAATNAAQVLAAEAAAKTGN